MIPVKQGTHRREGYWIWPYPWYHPSHDVECVTCHLEGVHIPWMAANSIHAICAMLDVVWRVLTILGITVCRVSAHHIQGVNTLDMGSKGCCRGW